MCNLNAGRERERDQEKAMTLKGLYAVRLEENGVKFGFVRQAAWLSRREI
jgi:hypothetical protein